MRDPQLPGPGDQDDPKAKRQKSNNADEGSRVQRVYSDEEIDSYLKGTMGPEARGQLIAQLVSDTELRKRCILSREGMSELEVHISAEAAKAFNDGLSALYSGNRNFPGHQWNSYGQRANELVFVRERERCYAKAKKSFEKLLELGELEDLALANLAIVEENIRNAPIAASFFPGAGHDHGAALLQEVQSGVSPTEAVFGKRAIPTKGERVPPTWQVGIPLRLLPDDRPIEELINCDVNNFSLASQLIRRLDEFIPQERGFLSSFDATKSLVQEAALKRLMENDNFVDALASFIEQPLPGGNDAQLSKLNDSRKVAFRLLAMRYCDSGDATLLSRIKGLYDQGLQSFRSRGGGDWETNWFHQGPEVIIHFSDQNDELWNIVADTISEASEVGVSEYFVNSLHLFTYTEAVAKLEHRFVNDLNARRLIEEKLIASSDKEVASYGLQALKGFSDAEKVRVVFSCLEGKYKPESYAVNGALNLLGELEVARLKIVKPEIVADLDAVLVREISERKKKYQREKGVEIPANRESREATSDKQDAIFLSSINLLEVGKLIYKIDPVQGKSSICKALDSFVETKERVGVKLLQDFAKFCVDRDISEARRHLISLYTDNIYNDANGIYTKMFLISLRDWGVTDSELVSGFTDNLKRSPKTDIQSYYYRFAYGYYLNAAYDQLIHSFQEEDTHDSHGILIGESINEGKNPSAWLPIVEAGIAAGDTRFLELVFQKEYQDLVTPELIRGTVEHYVEAVLAERAYDVEHEDKDAQRLFEVLQGFAHLQSTRPTLLAAVENQMKKFESSEQVAAHEKNPRLLYFLRQLQNKSIAVAVNDLEKNIGPELRSWLFFTQELEVPYEIFELIFDYCLNDREKGSLSSLNSYDSYSQLEAVQYVSKLFTLLSAAEEDAESSESLISFQSLETYINNVVVGRKVPVESLLAGYRFQLSRLSFNGTREEQIEAMSYPVLGVTEAGMNHRGPVIQSLSSRIDKIYQHFRFNLRSINFEHREEGERDITAAFFLSALFRIGKFEAIEVFRNNPIRDLELNKKVARFASMGAAEAEEDENFELALEMAHVLREVLDVIPEGEILEGMERNDFLRLVEEKIQDIGALAATELAKKIEAKIKEHPNVAEEMEQAVRATILAIRAALSGDAAKDDSFYHSVSLMRDSLVCNIVNGRPSGTSFGSWDVIRAKTLGYDACQEIGIRVCREMNFTLDEIKNL